MVYDKFIKNQIKKVEFKISHYGQVKLENIYKMGRRDKYST